MAVYTHLQQEEFEALAMAYGLGMLHRAMPIAEGIENSNFLLEYERPGEARERAILTVYEKRVKREDVPFYLSLMEHLAGRGVPSPRPLKRLDGAAFSEVRNGKRAAMVTFLPGYSVTTPGVAHLTALGTSVAQLHAAVGDFPLQRENDLGLSGWQRLFAAVESRADSIHPGLSSLVGRELEYLEKHWPHGLPSGVVHADLFPDNVFFVSERVSGLIDWYFACTDAFLYDLVITMNAWCFDAQGQLDKALSYAFLAAYTQARPVSRDEAEQLPILARGASLRFLLTRAYDWLNRQEGALVTVKDPMEYVKKLAFHQSVTDAGAYGI